MHKIRLWVDTINKCNLICKLCYAPSPMEYSFINENDINVLVTQIKATNNKIAQITLNWFGEPLLNPNFDNHLFLIRREIHDCYIEFHTNATLIDHKRAQSLIKKAQGCTICLSIDGGSKYLHDFQRGKGSYEKTIMGTKYLISARKSLSSPRIILHQLNLGLDKDQYDLDFIYVKNNVDDYLVKNPINRNGLRCTIKSTENIDSINSVGISETISCTNISQPRGPCFWVGNCLFISPNLDVFPCLLSHPPTNALGNLRYESIDSLIESAQKIRSFIKKEGRNNFEHCRNCLIEEGEAF